MATYKFVLITEAFVEADWVAPEFSQALVDMGRHARTTLVSRFPITAMLEAYAQLYRAHARTA